MSKFLAGVWKSGEAAKLFSGGKFQQPVNTPAVRSGTTDITRGTAAALALGKAPFAPQFFAGLIDEVAIRASAATEGELATMELNYLTPRDFYGVGSLNSAAVANRSPVAVPIVAAATVGVLSEVDPAARALEPDGDTKTLSALTGTGGGTSAIVGGRAQFTPTAVGTYRRQATVRDPGLKSSTAPIIWLVSAPLPPSAELPPPLNTINVSTAAQLSAALVGRSPGDHIVLAGTAAAPITYAGNFTLSANGGAPTNANRTGVPIVVRAANILGARFTGAFNLNGVNTCLYGADFDGQLLDGPGITRIKVNLNGDYSRVMRTRFRRLRQDATVLPGDTKARTSTANVEMAGYNVKVWYCEFTDWDGRGITMRTPSDASIGASTLYPHVYGCRWHDNAVPPAISDGNARECMQMGQTQGSTGLYVNENIFCLLENSRIDNCYTGGAAAGHDENEPLSIKSSGNTVSRLTLGPGMGGGCLINIRFGNENTIKSCLVISGNGIGVYGDDNVLIANEARGSSRIQVHAGNQWMDIGTTGENAAAQAGMTNGKLVWRDPQANPTARRTKLIANKGTLRIGHITGSNPDKPILKTKGARIYGHVSGEIQTQASYGFSTSVAGLREEDTANSTSTAGQPTAPAATEVTLAEVGLFAPFVAPTLWPPTLP